MNTNLLSKRRDAVAMEARRLQAVEAMESGESLSEIARCLGVSRQAVWKWRQALRRGGTPGLRRRPRPGRPPKLSSRQRERLPKLLAHGADAYGFATPVWTTGRVTELVRRRFHVEYHPDHVGRLLHRCGLTWQKVSGRAVERDEKAIARWVSHTWPRLKKSPRATGSDGLP